MADEPEAIQPIAEEPYDLGDTELYPKAESASPQGAAQEPSIAEVVPPSDAEPAPAPTPSDKPRNPDGTFKKVEPSHPSFLVEQARDCGFSEAEMAGMSTEALGMAVNKIHRAVHITREQNAKQRDANNAEVRAKPPEEPVLEGEDDFDPRIVSALKKLRDESQSLRQYHAQKEEQTNSDMLDDAFEALGPSFEKIVGKGAMADLPKGGPEQKRRIAIMHAGGISLKTVDRHIKSKLKAAADLLYAPAVAPPEPTEEEDAYAAADKPAKPRISKEQWNNGGVARPTARKGAAEPKGEQLAIRNLEAKLRSEGGEVATDSEIMDGLPGD